MDFVLIPHISTMYAENCGQAILSPGWTHRRRNLDSSVFILGHQGYVDLLEEERPLSIGPKSFCLLSEGQNHWGAGTLEEPARYYWIHFRTSEPPQIIPERDSYIILNNKEIRRTRLKDSLLLPINMQLKNTQILRELFHDLLYEQQNSSFIMTKYQSMVRLMLIRLNEIVLDDLSPKDLKTANTSLVNNIIPLIYEHIHDRDFSVKRLADIMCYNPDYLNRHFKAIMKRSLIEYIIDLRIEHSLTEIIDTNNNLENIAHHSGFSTYRNFIRQFKLRKNITPSEYRSRHRIMHITNK